MSLKITFKTLQTLKDLVPEPVPAYKSFPEWFSKLPKSSSKCPFSAVGGNLFNLQFSASNGIAGCLGIQDFLKTGYIIPSWTTFIFRENFDGQLYLNWPENPLHQTYQMHGEDQYFQMKNPPVYDHFCKLNTPWIIKTQPGVSCLITHPVWHRNTSFTTSTGIYHTDKVPLTLPWFFEWNYKIESQMFLDELNTEKQVIERNEPLMLIIPFYRKNYTSEVQYIDEHEFKKLNLIQYNNTHKSKTDDLYRKFRKSLGILFK